MQRMHHPFPCRRRQPHPQPLLLTCCSSCACLSSSPRLSCPVLSCPVLSCSHPVPHRSPCQSSRTASMTAPALPTSRSWSSATRQTPAAWTRPGACFSRPWVGSRAARSSAERCGAVQGSAGQRSAGQCGAARGSAGQRSAGQHRAAQRRAGQAGQRRAGQRRAGQGMGLRFPWE